METTQFKKFNRIAQYCAHLLELTPDKIGEICAQMFDLNARINNAFNGTPIRDWRDAEEWEILSTLQSLLFNRICLDAPASAEHDRWLVERTSQGWAYGPVRDDALKHNPNMVPYGDLPAHQRYKDALFQALSRQGLEVAPTCYRFHPGELDAVYRLMGKLDSDNTLFELSNTLYYSRRIWAPHQTSNVLRNIMLHLSSKSSPQ